MYLLNAILLLPAAVNPDALRAPAEQRLVPSHRFAEWLINIIDQCLKAVGLERYVALHEVIYVVVIAAVALAIGIAVKSVALAVTRRMVRLRHSETGAELLRERTFTRCSHVITPLVFMALIPFAFNSNSQVLWWILRAVGVYALIAFGVGVTAVVTFIFNRYNARDNTRGLPLRGILNLCIGIVWIIVAILAVSVIVDRSPAVLLAGLGAFAAALMLIFKDSILGFVAGIQMSQNDMLHVGDWIVVPGTPANGTVLDVSLSTVKVQNFDNTIITIPPYTLVSGAFQNWRGMKDSGVRRIMQNFMIDWPGIVPLSDSVLNAVTAKYPQMAQVVANMRSADKNGWATGGGERPLNGTLETNLGLFRAYLCMYLMNNPLVSSNHRVLVQLLDPTISAQPLQIWCWAATTDWNEYEAIQSAIMEHVITTAPVFGLAIYTSGSDTITLVNAPAKS